MHLRRWIFLLLFPFALAALGPPVFAQASGSITSTECVSISADAQSTVGIQVVGTWTGTLVPQISIQGQAPVTLQVTPSTSATAQSTITANGVYQAKVAGGSIFQVCGNTVASGTAKIYLNASQGVAVIIPPAPAAGVTSFNSRTGAVLPAANDYTWDLIGAGSNLNAQTMGTGGSLKPVNSGIIQATSVVPAAANLPSGLISLYLMNEGSGTTLTDTSGSGNNATFAASNPVWLSGPGFGLSFTNQQEVNLPANLQATRTWLIYYTSQTQTNVINSVINNGLSNWALQIVNSCWNARGIGCNTPQSNEANWITAPGGAYFGTKVSANGTAALVVTTGRSGDSTCDTFWLNGQSYSNTKNVGACPQVASITGSFFVGGASSTGFCENIYMMAAWNRVLTATEIQQVQAQVNQYMATRGVPPTFNNTSTTDTFIADGDSLTQTYFIGTIHPYPSLLTLNGTWSISNEGVPGASLITASGITNGDENVAPLHFPAVTVSGRNLVLVWEGTNDMGSHSQTAAATFSALLTYAKNIRAQGYKLIVATTIDRTLISAARDTYNTFIRNTPLGLYWDGLADIAADVNIGADGSNTNTNFFNADKIHVLEGSNYNVLTPVFQRAINRLYGNTSWTSATTYTTGAAAATAITAASEATNTVTITSTLNPPVGSCVVITGVTPANYNSGVASTTPQCWLVLTTSGTNFTYYNQITGLGAGSVFGTASVPLQVDADQYVILGGSAAGNPSFTLQSCVGYTGQNLYLKNSNTTSAWVLTPFGSETIDGAASLTMATASSGNFPVIVLQSVLVSSAAAGCNWQRVQ